MASRFSFQLTTTLHKSIGLARISKLDVRETYQLQVK
jgi:hypothetical protein